MAVKKWTNVTNWEQVPQVLDLAGLMSILRISKPTALKLLNEGQIKGKMVGGSWRISKDVVRMFLEPRIIVVKEGEIIT